jgi:Fe-S-cluster containining protein
VTEAPWYAAGLRFGCTRCGACCTGSPGAVWVDEQEIDALAAALDIAVPQFERDYVRQEGSRRKLYEWPSGDCVLYEPDGQSCSCHQARPRQCRRWPFWDRNLESERAWQAASELCPGFAEGEILSLAQIQAWRRG